jgi:hypothetical protein
MEPVLSVITLDLIQRLLHILIIGLLAILVIRLNRSR